MGIFKIRYICRCGRRQEETIFAKTKRLARLKAEAEHDDVISVKRAPIRWGKVFLYLIIIAGVVALVHFA